MPLSRLRRIFGIALRPLDYALELIYPSSCLICERPTPCPPFSLVSRERPLDSLFCPACRRELTLSPSVFCKRCGRIVRDPATMDKCGVCTQDEFYFNEVRPLHFYRKIPRAAVIRMKHDEKHILAKAIAQLYFQERRRQLEEFEPDCIVGVPMNWRRRMLRGGINAPEIMAKIIAQKLHIPCLSKNIKRSRSTMTQESVEWDERLINVYDAFEIYEFTSKFQSFIRRSIEQVLTNTWSIFPNQKKDFRFIERSIERFMQKKLTPKDCIFKGKRVILVDDVFTTGATTNEIARILIDAGASAVMVAVITRAGLGKKRR